MPVLIPLSPLFLKFVKNVVYHIPQQHQFTLKPSEIDTHLKNPDVIKDIPRLSFQMEKNDEPIIGGHHYTAELTLINLQIMSGMVDLTKEETRALAAIATTSGQQKWSQEGLFRSCYVMMCTWMNLYQIVFPKGNAPVQISRDSKNSAILHAIHDNEIYTQDGSLLATYQYHATVLQENGVFHVGLDEDNYLFTVTEEVWKEILQQAGKRLEDATPLTDIDLFLLVPCLVDPAFEKAFAKRLKNESQEIKEQAEEFKKLCFDATFKRLTAINNLKTECEKYKKYLNEIKDKRAGNIDELNETLQAGQKLDALEMLTLNLNASLSPQEKIDEFKQTFSTVKGFFNDKSGKQFLKNIQRILSSLMKLGVYATIKAKDSNKKRGLMFWKTTDDLGFIRKIEEIAAPANKRRST